jgi:type I restriction enzyme S subunit
MEAIGEDGSLNLEQVKEVGENLSIVVPPLQEQQEIASLLDSASGDANLLIVEAEKAIALLQERRSALISAAVTGQIDVRGLVPEASAA